MRTDRPIFRKLRYFSGRGGTPTLMWTMNAFLSGWYSREKWRVPTPLSFSSPRGLSTAGAGAWLVKLLDGDGRPWRSTAPGWVKPAWGEGSSRSGELRTVCCWWWWNGLVVKFPFRSRFSRSSWRAGLVSLLAVLISDGVWQFPLMSVLLTSPAAAVAANVFLPLRPSG